MRSASRLPLLSILATVLLAAGCGPSVRTGEVRAPDGVPIAYEAHGDGDVALVFVHGWSCDRSYWREQVDAFARDHRVVLVDLAGHGGSGDQREDWTIAAFGADVAAVVDALELERVVLIGHSMGGAVVAQAGELLGERVAGLIGVDTLQDIEESYTAAQIAGFTGPMDANFRVTTRAFVRSMFPADADSALMHDVAEDMAAAPPHVAVPAIRSYLAHPVSEILDRYRPRVRCINSDLWPTDVEHGRAHCAEFEVETLMGVGHFLFLEDPPLFNAALADAVRSLLS